MADPADPLAAFAPPEGPPSRSRTSIRDALGFVVDRVLRLLLGPFTLMLAPLLLGVNDARATAAAAAVGVACWLPTSFLLFRVLFFPSPPDPGLFDTRDQPASARDLRAWVRAHAAEHVLGTVPLFFLLLYAKRAFDPRLALPAVLVGSGLILWREVRAVVQLVLQEADIDLATGNDQRAAARLGQLARWPLPGFGGRAWMVLARARFRAGDARGALEALARAKDDDWRQRALRAQMGITVLPEAELLAIRDELAAGDDDQAAVGWVVDTLWRLDRGRPLAEDAEARLDALPEGEPRRLGCLLVAASLAERAPDRARALLIRGRFDVDRLPALRRTWPAVARALEPLVPHPTTGEVR